MSRLKLSLISLTSILVLVACTNDATKPAKEGAKQTEETAQVNQEMGHDMVHDESEGLPNGIKEVADPTYKVGDKVIIKTDHIPGMKGAKATIVGAFDTYAYGITYEDSKIDEMIENHKWVIQEELTQAKNQVEPLKLGDVATVDASHMARMDGQVATITEVQDTTVYMVDYRPTDGGDSIKKYKWVTEEELAPTP